MKVVWRRISLFFLLISLFAGIFLSIRSYDMREQMKEQLLRKTQVIVKTLMIECIPQFDYMERDNIEICYQWTKSMIAKHIIPIWNYQELYGYHKNDFIQENTIPSFFLIKRKKEDSQESQTRIKKIRKKDLYDQWYLRKNFLQVDSTTTITNHELNGKKLFGKDLKLTSSKSPQILIYHTHGSEAYADSRSGNKSDTVIGIGDCLTELLEQKGFTVIHDKSSYDVRNGKLDRSKAYTYAAQGIEANLKKYPQIQVIIDLHRDGVAEGTKLVTTQNGKKMAQVMFFNGMSRTATNGNITYLNNPNIEWNLAYSLQMQRIAYERYPGFTRKIYIKGYRYNLHYRKRSMLVEVGAQTNTVAEAKNAMEPLADVITSVLK